MSDGITKIGSEFQVSTETLDQQRAPDIAYLADGGYVIVWQSFSQDIEDQFAIYGQRYDANGNTVGSEFMYDSQSFLGAYSPVVTGLSNGGFVVVARSVDGGDVSAQIYDANGAILVSEFRVNTSTSSDQSEPSVTELVGGGFVIAWTTTHDSSNSGEIYGQQYDAAGDKVGFEFLINTTKDGYQAKSNITALADGGFVVSWSDYSDTDGDRHGVYAQMFTALSVKSGGEFQVNSYTTERQSNSSAAGLKDGGFVITWQSFGQETSGTGNGIFAQRYDVTGATVGSEFQVNTRGSLYQLDASVAALADGGFVIVYASESGDFNNYGIVAQRYDANGDTVGDEVVINTYTTLSQSAPSVTALVNGGFTVTWQSDGQDSDGLGIYAQQFAAELWGTEGNDLIEDTVGANWIKGRGGKDYIDGKGGDDTISGGYGKDKLIGGYGKDTLDGGAKNDILKGGKGIDTLLGKSGDDKLTGGAGNDILTGGSGADKFIFKSSNDSGTGSATDVITDFEIGSDLVVMSALNVIYIGSDAFSAPNARGGADPETIYLPSPGELRITDNGVDSKIKVDVDGDGNIDMKIIVEGVVGLTESDFIL